MPEMTIRFKYDFSKLHGQRSGLLIYCQPFSYNCEDDLGWQARDYDTDKRMALPFGDYLLLVFLGDKNIPFTTYRKFNLENFERYCRHVGYNFKFKVEEGNETR